LIDRTAFAAGMSAIGLAVRQEADAATMALYHDILGPRTDADEWARFVRWALEGGRWTWLPKLVELQDALREFRGDRPLLVEATEAYERVLQSGTYIGDGTQWIYRDIREKCGEAAAEAFLAAGGHHAFATTFRESDRRERFLAAYQEAVRQDPDARLLPAGPVRALPPAEMPLSREEAASVIERLHWIADVEPAKPSRARPLTEEEWEARRRALEQQGREMLGSEVAAKEAVAK
jgi:hypothetical protein